ncbi:MAG: hypothetical protein KatS3mg031_0504 [Chitinophagales bacterium]|nr:MAG: hypothetical protein KatS3mg031_0504 [Chitinophagales bacterium]
MMRLLRQRWWKFLGIPLLVYSVVAGLYIPLGPGIVSVKPDSTQRGTVIALDIITYNTHFREGDPSLNVVLKNEHNLICNNDITYISPTHLNVEFGIDPNLKIIGKKDFYNLIIYNEQDGTFFLRDAFAIGRQDSVVGTAFQCLTILKPASPSGITIPNREILYESIRNLFYHVPMWFTMILLMLFSFVSSILYLSKARATDDLMASSSAVVGLFFGLLGILTGMQWAKVTWGAMWVSDPKLNGAALGILVYLAYFVLRGSLTNAQSRARISAVYNVFAFVLFIVFILIVPRMTDSLHPGSGGNPGFNTYDLDHVMRPIFYSAVAGFTIVGFWLVSLITRYRILKSSSSENQYL